MTKKEIQEIERSQRERVATSLLMQMWPKYEIKDTMQRLFGIARTTAAKDINRAKDRLAEEGGESRESRRYKVGAFLEGFMSAYDLDPQERLRAAKQYCELYGLNDRTEQEPQQQDIRIVIPDWRAEMKERLASGQAKSAKELNGGNGCQSIVTNLNGKNGSHGNGNGNGKHQNGSNGNGLNGNGNGNGKP